MAKTNKVSAEIPTADLAAMITSINSIKDKLPFLIALLPDEKREMAKVGDKTVAFIMKALEYAQTTPTFVPTFLSVTEFAKDVKIITDLLKVFRPLQQLTTNLEDTIMQANTEAYHAALTYYSTVKGAMKAGEPNAKIIHEDLAERFPGKPRKASAEPIS